MTELISGQTAVVTGGSSGIGRAISLKFAAHGANVIIADTREEPREGGKPTHKKISSNFGVSSEYVNCDVRDLEDHHTTAKAALNLTGDLDIWVNNAGISGEPSFKNAAEEHFNRIMAVNAKGAFFGAQVAAEKIETGSIINISSLAGIKGYSNLPIYAMTKGAIRLLTYSLASELSPSIRVNAIHPGAVETVLSMQGNQRLTSENRLEYAKSIPLERIGQPEDIGNAALFLASDLADYITGHSLVVDGGLNNIR